MAENENESGKELREKYEKALADLAAANTRIDTLQADSAFKDVTVSDRQRKIILRELGEDKLDVTAENVQAVAKDLGFAQAPPPPATDPPANGQQTQNQGDQQNGNGQQQTTVDGDILVSLNEMNSIDRANYNARRGNISPDLETEMRNAKSPEELTTLIRTKGAQSGLVHEWDTQ